MRVVVECVDQIWTACFLKGRMVALNNNFAKNPGAGIRKKEPGCPVVPPCESYWSMIGDLCPLRRSAAGVWFADEDVQSTYGANEIIYCGYPDYGIVIMVIGTGLYDPESELYYVRNRTYNPVLGRWIQRDPVGYAGGVNLYEYAGGRAVVAADAEGTNAVTVTDRYFCPPADPDFAFCFGNCTCTVGKPYKFGKLVNNFTLGMAMASVMLACCVESCSVCTLFRSPRSQPPLMSECVTLNVSVIFPFATTTCTCT